MYVAIDRGTPKAGPLGKDQTLPAEASTTPVDVSRVLQTFDDDTRRRLHGLLHAIGPGLRDNGAQLNRSFVAIAPFLQEARRLAAVLSDRRRAVERAVTNFGVLTEALGTGDRQLARLVRNGEETLSELASRDHALSGLLAELPRVLGSLQRSMTTLGVAQGDLDPALENLRPVAAKLEQSLRSLERFGVALRPAAEALAPAVRGLRPLARDVRPTSSSLVGAFAELGAQAKSYDTLTKELLPCREMARDFYSNTPSVFKFGNAFGAFPRGDLSFAPQSAGGFGSANLTRASSCTDGNGKTGGRK
jgi:phospholipid/cholesterol/gamma-HCH transport system substrate-binding protein